MLIHQLLQQDQFVDTALRQIGQCVRELAHAPTLGEIDDFGAHGAAPSAATERAAGMDMSRDSASVLLFTPQ